MIVTGSFLGGGSNEGNVFGNTNRYELQNYTSVSSGKHFVKFGARLREVTDRFDSTTGFNGSFSILPASTRIKAGKPTNLWSPRAAPDPEISTRDLTGALRGDDRRIRPNVTLSYGLRFETQNHISDHADWAPRIGIAWGLGRGKTPKTVPRQGYGIFYDRFTDNLILQATRLNGNIQQQYASQSRLPNVNGGDSAVVRRAGGPITVQRSSNRAQSARPEMMQNRASLERQLSKVATYRFRI